MKNSSETKKQNAIRRYSGGLICLLIAVALTTGTLSAYFSDIVKGSGTATAGSLDLTGDYLFYINGGGVPIASVGNLNPGDVVVVKATIANVGNKSAWVREVIDLGILDIDLEPFIQLYSGEKTGAALMSDRITDRLIPTNGSFATAPCIIDGSGADAETESVAGVSIGASFYSVVFSIYFLQEAPNKSQGKTFVISAYTQALQYRNNHSATPDENAWSTVVTSPFGN
ncbi:MAG: M73 family metallopeptidase [Clostridiales bacterium]|nr:M73 family metallopeptidase [Clostridiales bacterium]